MAIRPPEAASISFFQG
ncbi:hypothetical protein BAL199_10682 [alpha proteobacterium BAL199]|nr:hypothetical protein BAL199_10682 [alpha proteobacterium BAL199]